MMRDNFRKLGRHKAATWTSFIGSGVIIALLSLSILVQRRFGGSASLSLGVPAAIAATEIAKRTQGAALDGHWNSGGRAQPFWKVLLVAVLSVGFLLVGASQLTAMLSTTAKLAGGYVVSIEGHATEADAARASAVLTEVGFLSPERPIDFTLGRSGKGWNLEFNLMAGAADDQEIRTGFEHAAKALCERAFGGQPSRSGWPMGSASSRSASNPTDAGA